MVLIRSSSNNGNTTYNSNNNNTITIIIKLKKLSLTELDPSSAAAFPHWMVTAIHCTRKW